MIQYQTEGVVLRVTDFREADRIVLFYTKNLGKLSALAPHAIKSRKRFGTSLNVFQLVQVKLKQSSQRSITLLEQARPLISFEGIYGDWRRIVAACAVVDFINEMTREGSANARVYQVCRDALIALNQGAAFLSVLAQFEYQLLDVTGYRPAISQCVGCHRRWETDESVYWVHQAGGIHCHRCLPDNVPFEIVAPELRRLLEQLAAGQVVTNQAAVSPAAILLYQFIRHQLGRPVRAWEFLEQMHLT